MKSRLGLLISSTTNQFRQSRDDVLCVLEQFLDVDVLPTVERRFVCHHDFNRTRVCDSIVPFLRRSALPRAFANIEHHTIGGFVRMST